MSPQGRVDLLISQKLVVRSLVDIVYLLLTNFFINEYFVIMIHNIYQLTITFKSPFIDFMKFHNWNDFRNFSL